MRTRSCQNPDCKKPFIPVRMGQRACCPWPCAIVVGKMDDAKKQRKEDQIRREKLKRRADYIAEAQTACNAYIRYRDRFETCICCGNLFEPDKPGGSMDAGHYLSRSLAPHLRFDERNIFGQRKNCNRPGGTTRAAFRAGVVRRIGLAAVEMLEADQSSPKWTITELIEIRDGYKAKLRALKECDRQVQLATVKPIVSESPQGTLI